LSDAPKHIGPVTFLVGCERSGTTLLRLMLDSHPQLAFHHEFEHAVEAMPDDEHWPELDAYYAFLSTYRLVPPRPPIDRSLDYPSLVRSFLEHKRVTDRKPRIGATVHRHFARLLRIWPDARFVHITRDGRDVASSCVGMGWYGNTFNAASRWLDVEQAWDRMQSEVPPDRRMCVRYENLVQKPVAVLTDICAFIGIAYHPAMLEYPSRSTYQSPSAKLAFQWRRKLGRREIQLLESRMADMLVARGYELSGLPARNPGRLERLALRIDNRAGVMRARIRSLGPRLWLESLAVTRIGPRRWRDSVAMRVNAVQNTQLA
jgi:hypothetical protein